MHRRLIVACLSVVAALGLFTGTAAAEPLTSDTSSAVCAPTIQILYSYANSPRSLQMGAGFQSSCPSTARLTWDATDSSGHSVWHQEQHNFQLTGDVQSLYTVWNIKSDLPTGTYRVTFSISSANGRALYAETTVDELAWTVGPGPIIHGPSLDGCTLTISSEEAGASYGPTGAGWGFEYVANCHVAARIVFSVLDPNGALVWQDVYHNYMLSTVDDWVNETWTPKFPPHGAYTLTWAIYSENGQDLYWAPPYGGFNITWP